MEAKFQSLLDLAKAIAVDRRAMVPSVIKEIMHYEIIQALLETEAVRDLVFQGGTALRLCYDGNRYSEDLDFAGGTAFEPSAMSGFMDRLTNNVGKTYGLTVEIDERLPDRNHTVPVGRWKAKIVLPQQDRSSKQPHVIHLEVAEVPAYSGEVRLVRPISSTAEYAYRSLMLKTESRQEILADKIVALGGREYLKQRDIWDIHMLAQSNIALDIGLIGQKIVDYHLAENSFLQKLAERIDQMKQVETQHAFSKEMSRFLDGSVQRFLQDKNFLDQVFTTVVSIAQQASSQIASKGEKERSSIRFKIR